MKLEQRGIRFKTKIAHNTKAFKKKRKLFWVGDFNIMLFIPIISLVLLVSLIQPEIFTGARWNFPEGFGMKSFDLSNLGAFATAIQMLFWVFTFPGDCLIVLVNALSHLSFFNSLSTGFLGLSTENYCGSASVIFSFLTWWMIGGRTLVRFWVLISVILLLDNFNFFGYLQEGGLQDVKNSVSSGFTSKNNEEFKLMLSPFILGIVEGLTEFLPISSTGHLILVRDYFKIPTPEGQMFEITIQFGAILAVLMLYFKKLSHIIRLYPSKKRARRFIHNILLAFLPAALFGVLLHGFIKDVLFNPFVIAMALITGGVIIIIVERLTIEAKFEKISDIDATTALKIGLFQAASMIPGTSRSGATIIGAMLLRVEKRAALEFSFFLAIPTMFGAMSFDLWQNRHLLDAENIKVISIGFIVAFITALLVVKWMIKFVAKNGFTIFGIYRILLGLIVLSLLYLGKFA